MKKLIDAHKFFCRKSQHYMMGNWNEYEVWFMYELDAYSFPTDKYIGFNWQKLRYTLYFPVAYFKFMYLTIFK